jgi:hypothetical protein
MFDKQLLTALEQVAREAIVLHEIEKTVGRDEDEEKRVRFTDRAEIPSKFIRFYNRTNLRV